MYSRLLRHALKSVKGSKIYSKRFGFCGRTTDECSGSCVWTPRTVLCFCSHPSIYSLRLVEAESIAGGNIKGNCVWNEIQMAMSMCIQFSLPAIAQGHTNRPSMANNVCFDWNDSFDVSLMFHTSQAVFSSSLIACLHQKKRQPLSLLSTCLDTFLACRFVCFLRKNEAIVF